MTRAADRAAPRTSLRLSVRVQPRASRDEVAGRYGEGIKIRLRAPPVDGAANEELVRFIAEMRQEQNVYCPNKCSMTIWSSAA